MLLWICLWRRGVEIWWLFFFRMVINMELIMVGFDVFWYLWMLVFVLKVWVVNIFVDLRDVCFKKVVRLFWNVLFLKVISGMVMVFFGKFYCKVFLVVRILLFFGEVLKILKIILLWILSWWIKRVVFWLLMWRIMVFFWVRWWNFDSRVVLLICLFWLIVLDDLRYKWIYF